MEIRKAIKEDFIQISSLMQELLGNPVFERKGYFEEALSSENFEALVAEIDDEVVGYLDIWIFPDVGHGANLGLIVNFIVDERYRKKGIGSKLLEESLRVAEDKKFHEFHVWTGFDNEKAKKVYKKYGFTNESLLLEREFNR